MQMKKYYYFSPKKLKFVEINKFHRKNSFLLFFFSILAAFFLFGIYYSVNEVINPFNDVTALRSQNRVLKNKLTTLLSQYKDFNKQINTLSETNNELRLAVNLPPILEEDKAVGIGGGKYSEIEPVTTTELENILTELNLYVDEISTKLQYEAQNYKEIETTLETNQKLYEIIPAIKPAEANYGDRFGMRNHPILNVRRMHAGVDLLANTGTEVYAPGGGVVSYIRRYGGSGLTLKIDHGFGYETLYSHLSKVKVKKGQKIKRGDLIALSGNSGGLSTGPHLHYEVRHNGIALNPKNFIFEDLKLFELISKE
jgi:murein DD-endopeptidase MepM/ murein hydrolase activator NlpD